MPIDKTVIKCKKIIYKVLITMMCLFFINEECDEDSTKKQVWIEYDAMNGTNILNFDDMKYELKSIDTTRRLNVISDQHTITNQEWLNDSNSEGIDEVDSYLLSNRTIIENFTSDSQGIYISAVCRLIRHYDSGSGRKVDSACVGMTYSNTDTSIHNDPTSAVAVYTIRDSISNGDQRSETMRYYVAHELGHGFNLDDHSGGCIMISFQGWGFAWHTFCVACGSIIKDSRP